MPEINPPVTRFNLNSVRPKDLKLILQRKSSRSSPGPDGIYYGTLKKLPCTHHFLATLYSTSCAPGLLGQVLRASISVTGWRSGRHGRLAERKFRPYIPNPWIAKSGPESMRLSRSRPDKRDPGLTRSRHCSRSPALLPFFVCMTVLDSCTCIRTPIARFLATPMHMSMIYAIFTGQLRPWFDKCMRGLCGKPVLPPPPPPPYSKDFLQCGHALKPPLQYSWLPKCIYTERQKKFITSSECHSRKSKASTWIIFGHRLGKFILFNKHI